MILQNIKIVLKINKYESRLTSYIVEIFNSTVNNLNCTVQRVALS